MSCVQVASVSLFVVGLTLIIRPPYSNTAVRPRVGFSFQGRRPGLQATAAYPIASRVPSTQDRTYVYLTTYSTRLWRTLQQVHRSPYPCEAV